MRIHYLTPYSIEKNIGKAYNEACALIPNGDWICLRDGDTMFLTPEWGEHIYSIAKQAEHDGISLVGCITNRLSTSSKQLEPGMYNIHDIKEHVPIAKRLRQEHGSVITPVNYVVSGMFMLMPKETWAMAPFKENTVHFDSIFSNDIARAGGKLGIAKGLYIYHGYRLFSTQKHPQYDYKHLIN